MCFFFNVLFVSRKLYGIPERCPVPSSFAKCSGINGFCIAFAGADTNGDNFSLHVARCGSHVRVQEAVLFPLYCFFTRAVRVYTLNGPAHSYIHSLTLIHTHMRWKWNCNEIKMEKRFCAHVSIFCFAAHLKTSALTNDRTNTSKHYHTYARGQGNETVWNRPLFLPARS